METNRRTETRSRDITPRTLSLTPLSALNLMSDFRQKVFIHFPRKGRGMVGRDTPAVRSGGFGFLLDYYWIKKE